MKKTNMLVVVVIPLLVMAVIVGAVFAYKLLGQPAPTTKAASPDSASVPYNPYTDSVTSGNGGGLNTVTATSGDSAAKADTDLNAELEQTTDDGGKSDLDAIAKDAASL